MRSVASQLRDSARHLNQIATEDGHKATSPLTETEAVATAMTEMKSSADEIARAQTAIDQLGADRNTIGAVADVIRGIAEQTHLLALNAAIGAARAGEQGRGLAAVPDSPRCGSVFGQAGPADDR